MVQAEVTRRRALASPLPVLSQAKSLLDSAQSRMGERSGWSRLAFPSSPSPDQRQQLGGADAEIQQARGIIDGAVFEAMRYLQELETQVAGYQHRGELLDRIRAQRAALENRVAELDRLVDRISASLARRSGSFWQRSAHFVEQLTFSDSETELKRLRELLKELSGETDPPILSAELNYIEGALEAEPLPKFHVPPRYMLGDSAPPLALEDTTAGREVELSPDILTQSQALAGVREVADFVRNQCRLEWYLGSLKGSTETLRSSRGNDADLATLTIALLRAKGIPARYVRGVIILSVGKLADLMKLLSAADLAALYAPGSTYVLPPVLRDRALAILNAAGIPYETILTDGQVTAVRLAHVWVEAFVAYADYRADRATSEATQWLPIEPSIAGGGKYAAAPPLLDALSAMGTTPAALVAQYLSTTTSQSALEFYRAQVQAYLAVSHPELTYQDTLSTVQPQTETLTMVPGTLPYQVVSVQSDDAFLPDSLKHRWHLTASDGTGVFLDLTLPLHQLLGHRSEFTFKPATPADAEVVNIAGGLYRAPAALVNVLAVVRSDGQEKAAATRALGLGRPFNWSAELLLPNASSRRIDNTGVAGNLFALGFGGPRNTFSEPATPPDGDTDGAAARFLYGRAAAFVNAWTDGEEEIARLLQVIPVRPTASMVFIENQLFVELLLGVPRQVHFKGLEVDADLRTLVPIEVVAGRGPGFLRLSGVEGSSQESKVLTQGASVQSISATGVIQTANAGGVTILLINSGNLEQQLQILQASDAIKADIRRHVGLGREVQIPITPLTVTDWTGTGYIVRDPTTEQGGYFLSGAVSGGQTVVSPASWSDQSLVDLLRRPDAPRSVDGAVDLSRVARIIPDPSTDLQRSVVGTRLPNKLAVYVTTIDGVPVRNAPVTFFLPSNSTARTKFVNPADPTGPPIDPPVSLTTDVSGLAQIYAIPETFMHQLVLESSVPNQHFIGLNLITAKTRNGTTDIVMASPFMEFGLTDVPYRFTSNTLPRGDQETRFTNPTLPAFEIDVPLEACAFDQYDNPLTNQVVNWTQAPPAAGAFLDRSGLPSDPRPQALDLTNPLQHVSVSQYTDLRGCVDNNFITGPQSGQINTWQATVPGGDPSRAHFLTWLYAIRTLATSDLPPTGPAYVARFGIGQVPPNGLYRDLFKTPLTIEIFRQGAREQPWTLLRGNEPGLTAFGRMRMVSSGGQLLRPEERVPPFYQSTGIDRAIDNDTTVVFRPDYLLNGDTATIYLGGVITEGGTTTFTTQLYFTVSSGTPTVRTRRLLPGGIDLPGDGCGSASLSDDAVVFKITNPATYSIYVRVSEFPVRQGERLVVMTSDPNIPSYPGFPEYLRLPGTYDATMTLPIRRGTSGGRVKLEVFREDLLKRFASIEPALTKVEGAENTAVLAPAGTALAAGGDDVVPRLVLPVRNFESSAVAGVPTVPPMPVPAPVQVCAKESGQLTILVEGAGQAVAGARVLFDPPTGQITLQRLPDGPLGPIPLVELSPTGALVWKALPRDPTRCLNGSINFLRDRDGATESSPFRLCTDLHDESARPLGHEFVKHVSTVDGHVFLSAEDVTLKVRGPQLSLTRGYTSRSAPEFNSLGRGWTHSYRSFAMVYVDDARHVTRYMLDGGDGTGQVFDCSSDTACTPQKGYRGTLRIDTTTRVPIFRSVTGWEFRYGPLQPEPASLPRHWLQQIKDPSGNVLSLRYSGANDDNEVKRVFEPGNRRFLEFYYERPPGAAHVRLTQVEARQMPNGSPTPPDDTSASTSLGICVQYSFNPRGMLATATRYDGACVSNPSGIPVVPLGAVARRETYSYLESVDPMVWNKIESVTNPNGHLISFAYYTPSDPPFPGETSFIRFGDRVERAKRVTEGPDASGAMANTFFSYELTTTTLSILGAQVDSYLTRIQSPRSVVPPTLYRMDAYGAGVKVERPYASGQSSSTLARWNRDKLWIDSMQDERGRVTTYGHDDFGNLTEERIATPVLAASGDAPASEPLTDGTGTTIIEVVEKRAYDLAFRIPTCQIDREGRLTKIDLDSNGVDPRVGTPIGTGLPLKVRRFAVAVAIAALTGPSGCADLAAAIPTDGRDIVTESHYCQVRSGACGTNQVTGDLSETLDGNQNLAKVLEVDPFGNPRQQQRTVTTNPLAVVLTTTSYDDRGRAIDQTDTLGHHTQWTYDGLDRPTLVQRFNTKGGNPVALIDRKTYFPAGGVASETNGLGLLRTYELDSLDRLVKVTESGGGLTAALVTRYEYDLVGNRTGVIDRRGVKTLTAYNWHDQPISVRLQVGDAAVYSAQRGETGTVGQAGLVATYGYDLADHKVFETDIHSHRTDYRVDPLYRVVKTVSPTVPGATSGAPPLQYTSSRRYDRVGNVTAETDGNSHTKTTDYDFANRPITLTDAVSRIERRGYDGNGNVLSESREAGGATNLSRTRAYDGLDREVDLNETVPRSAGLTPPSWSYRQQTAYDDAAHKLSVRDRRGVVVTRVLDDLDRAYQELVDDDSGLLSRTVDSSAGPALRLDSRFEYDADGNRSASVDPLGRRTEEVRDGLDRLTLRRLPMAVTESWVYDGAGRVIEQTDRRGTVSRATFDLSGRPVKSILVEVGTELTVKSNQYSDTPAPSLTVSVWETDANFHTTTRALDGLHREVTTTDALSHAAQNFYNATVKVSTTDRKGYTTNFGYDAADRLTQQTELNLNGTVRYTQTTVFDDQHRKQTRNDRRTIATVTELDGLDRPERVTRGALPDQRVDLTKYDGVNNVVETTDPNSKVTAYVFDGGNRRISETRGVGTLEVATTRYRYDAAGNQRERKSDRVTGSTFDVLTSYDDLNRAVRREDALGNVITSAYDGAGNKVCEKQPLGGAPLTREGAAGMTVAQLQALVCAGAQATQWAYEETNKLISITDALSNVTSFVYDRARNLVAKQDGNLNLTTYEYDALNRRQAEHQFLDAFSSRLTVADRDSLPVANPPDIVGGTGALTWTWAYDFNDNQTDSVDPKGQLIQRLYGVLNRLERKDFLQWASPRELPSIERIEQTYDENGNLTQVIESKRTTAGLVPEVTLRQFDGLDRLKTETRYDGQVTAYGYDPKGNRLSVTDRDLVATTYTFDALDRIFTAVLPDGTVTYSYYPDSLLKGISRPNGVNEKRCYDAANRLLQILTARGTMADDCTTAAPVLSRFTYSYDNNGNRLQEVQQRTDPATQTLRAAETTLYGYDDLNRLTGVRYPDTRGLLYRLDPVGNRTGEREVPNYTGDLGPGAFALATGFTRDVTGAFNRLDWLLSLTDALDATRTVTLTYDLNGNSIGKQVGTLSRELRWDIRDTLTVVFDNTVEVGRYDYDRNLQRVKRLSGLQQVEYGLDDKFVLVESDGTQTSHPSTRRYHYGQAPLAVTEIGGSRISTFVGVDAQGSLSDQSTLAGTIATARQYDAWGHYRSSAPALGEPKLGYTGHQFDPETGLIYARARYYDADIGRFLSRDTVEGTLSNAPSLHRYMYVRVNPLRYTDPDGNSDTAADAARRWEEQRAEYQKWLAAQLTPDDSFAKLAGLALTTVSVELGAGMMDLFKLGEGAAEGGWRGWGKDTVRALALGLMLKGTVRVNKEPPLQESGPAPAPAKVVEEPAGPVGDSAKARALQEPPPAETPLTLPPRASFSLAQAGSAPAESAVPTVENVPTNAPEIRPATQQPTGGNGVILSDAQGATPAEVAASTGGPTGGTRAGQAAVRQRLLDEAAASGKPYTCWRCGQTSTNPSNMQVGHRNVPTSRGGNLNPPNVCLEGAACNQSAGNRGAPKAGMSCFERGSCGAPYGRSD